ncbi:hypothetical protein TVAG_121750 [Trichomonas vaginalis G3]|uniref:Uncharacterized protein n=1 Tax=Trichomonas vaginalis (strain ATCC PRA-98 / G3) TaxID=412133 RepID=A2E986_TRIV3|nr:hypothetical protein TVAGG3_0421480 [Trichomonas vaginalis G3]EAY10771.1 hypothetical protein TVAG_121750 [Trichomonas vaginalis G3]KAI5536091.1 hypothetical protein TVAGG3_0421480 [Trichomonas vaginalis G3]|eukprot:XP_001322994.1 hypothetical protein [Trichomonas vaginalis G3]
MKIFYHNLLGGLFANKSEAKSINTTYKYSIPTEVTDEFRDQDNKFTFALVYPEINLYNIWQQTNNPLNERPKAANNSHYYVEGYYNITILANRNETNCIWGGLLLSHTENLMDGCPGGKDWFYTIGYVGTGWRADKQLLIPSNDSGVNIVSLWVKVIDDKYKVMLTCKANNYAIFSNKLFYLVFVMISE